MARHSMQVAVYAGTLDSQPLVFAHLLDAVPGLDLDYVEVICGADPGPRLAHAMAPEDAAAVEDALGLQTTVVLIFDRAMPPGLRLPEATGRLTYLASFTGHRHLP